MSFDTGSRIVVQSDLTEAQEQSRNESLERYRKEYTDIQTQISGANDTLAQVNKMISDRTSELNRMSLQTVAGLNDQVTELNKLIADLTDQLNKLTDEIAAKQATSAGIFTGIDQKQQELILKQDDITKQATIIAQANADLDQKAKDLDTQAASVQIRLDARESDIKIEEQKISDREAAVSVREEDVAQLEAHNTQLAKTLADQQVSITNQLQDLEQKKEAALAIMAQADEVSMMKAAAQAQEDAASAQAKINQSDAQQIKVAQEAISNRTLDLNNRQSLIEQAEQKIANGG